jgi:hypothetical protein
MMKWLSFCILIFSFTWFSCGKSIVDPKQHSGTAYFPIFSDSIINYRVDSLLFKIGQRGLEIDTNQYIVKEIPQFASIENHDTCVIFKSIFSKIDQSAVFEHTLQKCKNGFGAKTTFANAIVQEIVFPPLKNRRWDGLINFNSEGYIETIRDEPIAPFRHWDKFIISETMDSLEIDSVWFYNLVKVVQIDFENALERRFSVSWFAANIGLVYAEKWILDTQNINQDPWKIKAQKGYIVRKWIVL